MSRKNNKLRNSAIMNNETFLSYYRRLLEISLSMFEWKNLPNTCDARFLEMGLFSKGAMVFFQDEVLEQFLCMQCLLGGALDVYNIPKERTAYASNGYRYQLSEKNSVVIYNNMLLTPAENTIKDYALRLYDIDRTIDVNIRAQKTPVLIKASESQRLSLLNAYQQYDGNQPVIYADESFNENNFAVLSTQAPFIAPELYELKVKIWNDALTYLGVPNVSYQKKERLIKDEVVRGSGGTMASRFSRLGMRQQACEQINNMFGLDVWCEYRDDEDGTQTEGGAVDE